MFQGLYLAKQCYIQCNGGKTNYCRHCSPTIVPRKCSWKGFTVCTKQNTRTGLTEVVLSLAWHHSDKLWLHIRVTTWSTRMLGWLGRCSLLWTPSGKTWTARFNLQRKSASVQHVPYDDNLTQSQLVYLSLALWLMSTMSPLVRHTHAHIHTLRKWLLCQTHCRSSCLHAKCSNHHQTAPSPPNFKWIKWIWKWSRSWS